MTTVSFLVPDISAPVLGPVTVIARSLQSKYDVQIVGPDFGRGVCEMYRDSFEYTVVSTPRLYRYPDFLWESHKLRQALRGDVVIAVKSFMHTVPLALQERQRRGSKAVVYLDEWDGALQAAKTSRERLSSWLREFHHPVSEVYSPHVERLIRRADKVVCSSTDLQQRFHGEVIPVGADCSLFAPQSTEAVAELKASLNLGQDPLIVFGGAVRKHKGMEQILEAISRVTQPTPKLLIVGPITPYLEELLSVQKYGDRLIAVGAQPKATMPLYLSLADIIALPMAETPFAQSQVPCKIFEAMAMGKPIIGTAVSDLEQILDGCGLVVPPGRDDLLAEAMTECLTNPDRASEMGRLAREKCERTYSIATMQASWERLIEELA